jgi:cell wall-associated NlpC family hydrolase
LLLDGRVRWVGSVVAGTLLGALGPPFTAAAGSPTTLAEPTGRPSAASAAVGDLQRQAAGLQLQILDAVQTYELARARSVQVGARARQLQRQAERAQAEASRRRVDLSRFAADLYRRGGVSQMPLVVLSLPERSDPAPSMHAISRLHSVGEAKSQRVMQAIAADRRARQLAAATVRAASIRRAAAVKAAQAYRSLEVKTAAVQAELGARLSTLDAAYRAREMEQEARNREAWRHWRRYLGDLAAAQVVPPAASQLNDPSALPARLRPVRGSDGRVVLGVAQVERAGAPLVVLPAETIRAVSAAFGAVGVPYAPEALGSHEFGCGGLTRFAWRRAGYLLAGDPAAQATGLQGVAPSQLQVGDLVFFGDRTVGIHHVALYIGAGLVLSSDPVAGKVGAQPLTREDMFAAARVTLPPLGGPAAAPTPAPGARPMRCGTSRAGNLGTSGGAWTTPLAKGTYSLSAPFGIAGGRWSSGHHTGQDFAAPIGTPVHAASDGVAQVQHPSWAGNLVRIQHGGNLESWYAHLSRVLVMPGQRVAAGTVIGTVGGLGNSTGPHLHFEARLAGRPVNPMLFLTGSRAGWGGFLNGMIPEAQLCRLGVGTHVLRCDAARAWTALSRAYARRFGEPLCVSDSYRSYQTQVKLFATKPDLAAPPGTSNHGWGLAVDLCGGVNDFRTSRHKWVADNAPRFRWRHPRWADRGGSRPEPWHFEFGPAS